MRRATLAVRDPDRAAPTRARGGGAPVRSERRGRLAWTTLSPRCPATWWCPRSRPRRRCPSWSRRSPDIPLVFEVVYSPWPTPLTANRAVRPHRPDRARPARGPGGEPGRGDDRAARRAGPARCAARPRRSWGRPGADVTDLYPVTAVVTGLAGVAAGGLVPRLIAWLPEPEPDEPDPAERDTELGASTDGRVEDAARGGARAAQGAVRRHRRPGRDWRGPCLGRVRRLRGRGWAWSSAGNRHAAGAAAAGPDRRRARRGSTGAPGCCRPSSSRRRTPWTIAMVLLVWLVDSRDPHDLERTAARLVGLRAVMFSPAVVHLPPRPGVRRRPAGRGAGAGARLGRLGRAACWGIWLGLLLGGDPGRAAPRWG